MNVSEQKILSHLEALESQNSVPVPTKTPPSSDVSATLSTPSYNYQINPSDEISPMQSEAHFITPDDGAERNVSLPSLQLESLTGSLTPEIGNETDLFDLDLLDLYFDSPLADSDGSLSFDKFV